MKNILIVEDDSFKADSLKSFLLGFHSQSQIQVVGSLVEATAIINKKVFDLILVDMAIPSHPSVAGGGAPKSLLTGGIDVLLELRYLNRSEPCIVVTQYPDIEISGSYYDLNKATNELKVQLDCNVIACIEYKEGDSSWEESLKNILDSI
ncbi:response regulator [Vibrio metoecus]|uniref:response regulator n=1 Tax=Vibrio metoecus TaxID=1481663 RepID=UPI0012AE105F|nr:response regulator [Vibrio metoecus]